MAYSTNTIQISMPKVSWLLATTHAGTQLLLALQSIVNQTYQKFEIIVVDDCSDIPIQEFLSNYFFANVHLTVYRNNQRMGLAFSLNRAISLSTGLYLARLDDDDYAHPHRLEMQLKILRTNPNIDMVSSNLQSASSISADLTDAYSATPVKPYSVETYRYDSSNTANWKALFSIVHPSVLFRRSFFDKYGMYDASFSRCQDHELWVRATTLGLSFATVNQPLVLYNQKRYGMIVALRIFYYQILAYKKHSKIWLSFYAFLALLSNLKRR